MDLWRLERLRLVRTNRLALLVGVYAFFGALGPITARYMREILEFVGGGELTGLQLSDPTPPDAITQFLSNASQLGVLAVVVVAAGAVTIDAKPEFGAFLRTRVRSVARLVVPRVVTVGAAAALAYLIGVALAVTLAAVLIGGLDAAAVVVGTLYGMVYLFFAVALTAAVSTRAGSLLTTVLLTVLVLVALPLLALVGALEPFVPSELVGALDRLVRGAPLTDPLPAAIVAAAAGAGLVAAAVRGNREPEL